LSDGAEPLGIEAIARRRAKLFDNEPSFEKSLNDIRGILTYRVLVRSQTSIVSLLVT